MSTTYKALVHNAPDQPLTLKTLPVPTSPLPLGTALVQPLYSNIASYTRSLVNGKYTRPVAYPFLPGHSCVARIEAVGADATFLKPGDIVWVDSFITARDDPDTQFLLGFFGGVTPAAQGLMAKAWPGGCFSEKAVVPLENCFVLPKLLFKDRKDGGRGYHLRDMAALSFILVGLAGLLDAGVAAGTTVIVAPATGKYSGGAVLAALALGAKVVAASRSKEKMEVLLRLPGAAERLSTVQLTGDVDQDAAALLNATGGKGAHVFMDVTPPLPSTPSHIPAAMRALRRNAQVILEGGLMTDISFNYLDAMLRNLTVRGKFMYERVQVERCIALIENGNLVLGEKAGLTVKRVCGLDGVVGAVDNGEGKEWWGGDLLVAPNGDA
ncbi:GroES-like protein [Lentithecium fluviatile CBS 122367]|uniref:GroES-like protein n=1 Tax=Lentithecium fluviatile CBS 122367 TaxID=1168545 RepID=A0A6G1JF13_9PLEO|nr:GroES-like protein [Lentithecium fluviatile CBS 122367]